MQTYEEVGEDALEGKVAYSNFSLEVDISFFFYFGNSNQITLGPTESFEKVEILDTLDVL